jgi:O-antigen/teichoic acid export membrane protein
LESEKKTSGGDKYSKLAGNTIIFAISSFSSKLLTLLVQPFLTYAMAEIADLGLAKILSQYANLLIPFVSMGMSNAIIRFGLDKGNSEKQVFTNGLLTILGGFGILILCWPVAQFLPDMAQYGFLIYIYVLMSCLRTLCTQFVRSRQWNKLVAVDGILCTFATLMFYVLYLVGFHWGANGYLLAIISGDLVSVLPLHHRQAVELCGAQGPEPGSLAADAPLFPAHDPGPDQLLGHQRIGPVLRARDVRRAGRPQR